MDKEIKDEDLYNEILFFYMRHSKKTDLLKELVGMTGVDPSLPYMLNVSYPVNRESIEVIFNTIINDMLKDIYLISDKLKMIKKYDLDIDQSE